MIEDGALVPHLRRLSRAGSMCGTWSASASDAVAQASVISTGTPRYRALTAGKWARRRLSHHPTDRADIFSKHKPGYSRIGFITAVGHHVREVPPAVPC